MQIRDVYSGSRIQGLKDPGSGSTSKNMFQDVHHGYRMRIFIPSRIRIQRSKKQHCFGEISNKIIILGLMLTVLVRIRTGTALYYGWFSHFPSSMLLNEEFPQGAGPNFEHGTYLASGALTHFATPQYGTVPHPKLNYVKPNFALPQPT